MARLVQAMLVLRLIRSARVLRVAQATSALGSWQAEEILKRL